METTYAATYRTAGEDCASPCGCCGHWLAARLWPSEYSESATLLAPVLHLFYRFRSLSSCSRPNAARGPSHLPQSANGSVCARVSASLLSSLIVVSYSH